jgi:UDP-N-acetyl-D-mannosaminuronate dehydrogenase
MSEQRQPVGVIGVGWVGLVTAACFAELGHPVIARDILQEKVDSLARGEVTIHEPELADLVRRNAERLTFTTDMAELLGADPAALRLRRHPADLLRRCRPLPGPRRGRGAARGQ